MVSNNEIKFAFVNSKSIKLIKASDELWLSGEWMSKLLEKALKDAVKANKCILGSKQVLGSVKDSKLIVVSDSVQNDVTEKIQSDAKKSNVPTMHFHGSSVALGKLCGLQFRVSTISFNSLSESNIKSIIKEAEKN